MDKENEALLVIDIQEDYTGKTAKSPFPYQDSERLITTVKITEMLPNRISSLYIFDKNLRIEIK